MANMDNDVFRVYLAYSALTTLKLLAMSTITAANRLIKKSYENPEDAVLDGPDGFKYVRRDPFIERIRRCHLNDLENITPFLITCLLYTFTGPSVYADTWHFRVFVISRFLHTFAYLMAIPQPTRSISMYVGWGVVVSMAVQCLKAGRF